MPTTVVTNSGNASVKEFVPTHNKMIAHLSYSKDILVFLEMFGAVMRQTQVPRSAERKYLKHLRNRLTYQGAGYLAKTRNYPIYGLRLLGGDVSNERGTDQMFPDERLRRNADGILLPSFLSWFWNQLWIMRKIENPTKTDALRVSRILSVLSFSKHLTIDQKRSRKRAQDKYQNSVKQMQGKLKNEILFDYSDPEYLSMIKFLASLGIDGQDKDMGFDGHCYSLKSLVGKRVHKPPVPPAYGKLHSRSAIANFGLDKNTYFNTPNRLINCVNRSYYSSLEYDGSLHIIAEPGGKYRGICPYVSPYAHSICLYRKSREALLRIRGNCNYDQELGHDVAQVMSRNYQTSISCDASDFSDTMDPCRLVYLAAALGSSGAVHYHGMLRVKLFDGSIVCSDTPLMGWKGTFDLASLMLAYSFWLHRNMFPKGRKVQCGDDYLGYGKLEEYKKAYEFIGCKLSEGKTVVSKTVTVFCGEMFWRGHNISPVRFSFSGLGGTDKYIGKLISRTRNFISSCNYSRSTKRFVFGKLKKILGNRYNGYLDFRLSSDLGGIPLDLKPPVALETHLKRNKEALFCALRNIPFEKETFDSYHTAFAHLPLGKPYDHINGIGSSLSPGSWPKTSRVDQGLRKRLLRERLAANKVSYHDVLLYSYDSTILLRP